MSKSNAKNGYWGLRKALRRTDPWLVGILAAGAGLRFKGLTFQSMWNDEISSAVISDPSRGLGDVITRTLQDVHPPLYQLLLWAWYSLAGYTDWSGRVLSAGFGILGIAAVFLLAEEIHGREAGLYAALIASLNYFHLYYSQEVRSYALLFLLSTVSFLLFARHLSRRTILSLIWYLVATLLLAYTHYFGLIVVAAQCGIVLLQMATEREDRAFRFRLLVVTSSTIAIGYLPLWSTVQRLRGLPGTWIARPEPRFFYSYFADYFQEPFLILLFSVLLLKGFIEIVGESRFERGRFLLVAWILFAFFLPFLRSLEHAPILTPRNTMIVLPAFITMIAIGLASFSDRRMRALLLMFIVLMSTTYLFRETRYYRTPTKQQWRELAAMTAEQQEAVYGWKWSPEYLTYYLQQWKSLKEIRGIGRLENDLEKGSTDLFWVVDAHAPPEELLGPDITARFRLSRLAEVRFLGAAAGLYGRNWVQLGSADLRVSPGYLEDGGVVRMPWNGVMETDPVQLDAGEHDVVFSVRGSAAGGRTPEFHLRVVHSQAPEPPILTRTYSTAEELRPIHESFRLPEPSSVVIRIEYSDDYSDESSGEDRNLELRGFALH